MKLPWQQRRTWLNGLAAAALLSWGPRAAAQTVLSLGNSAPSLPQLLVDQSIAVQGPLLGPVPPPTPFTFGPLSLQPQFGYTWMDESNVLIAPGADRSSIVQTLAPVLTGHLGQNWSFSYAPSWMLYSNSAFHNALDQQASIQAAFAPASWLVTASQQVSITSDPETETAMQTSEHIYVTGVSVSKSVSKALALTGSVSQQITEASVLYPTSRQWSASSGIQYQWIPQVNLGLRLNGAYFMVVDSTAGFDISPTADLTILTFGRLLTLNAVAGLTEQTDYQHRQSSRTTAPQFSLNATVHPWTGTGITLAAGSGETFSYLADDGVRSSNLGLSLDQQFLNHLDLQIRGNRSEIAYQSTTVSPFISSALGREDRINSLIASLGIVGFLQRASLKVTYQLNRNESTIGAYSYASHEIGFQFNFSY